MQANLQYLATYTFRDLADANILKLNETLAK